MDAIKLLVLDETGYKGKLDVNFESSLKDLSIIQNGLRQSGLKLVKEDRVVDVFVLRRC